MKVQKLFGISIRFVIAFVVFATGHSLGVYSLKEHAREEQMLGFSLGSGPGKYESVVAGVSGSGARSLFTFRVGRMIQASLLLEAECGGSADAATTTGN